MTTPTARQLMGSNTVLAPGRTLCCRADPPFVGTGMEFRSAYDSGSVLVAKRDGVVEYVDAAKVVVAADSRDESAVRSTLDTYKLTKYKRSNQDTSVNQKPQVYKGQKVRKGQAIADGPATPPGRASPWARTSWSRSSPGTATTTRMRSSSAERLV